MTSGHTAAMAGSVVVGPATRKASAAAGFMPWVSRPLTIGNAVRLVVYAGTPNNAEKMIAKGCCWPRTPDIQACGTYRVIKPSSKNAKAINFATIAVALAISLNSRRQKRSEVSPSPQG